MKANPRRISVSEWVVATLGLILLALAVSVLLFTSTSGQVPIIVFEVGKTISTDAGFLVQAQAMNRGDVAASKVNVRATLTVGSNLVEVRNAIVDYVPAHSTKELGFYFTSDPSSGKIQIRAESYVQP